MLPGVILTGTEHSDSRYPSPTLQDLEPDAKLDSSPSVKLS